MTPNGQDPEICYTGVLQCLWSCLWLLATFGWGTEIEVVEAWGEENTVAHRSADGTGALSLSQAWGECLDIVFTPGEEKGAERVKR